MKRLVKWLVNLALVAASITAAFILLHACDRAASVFLRHAALSRHMGLLFLPGVEDHFAMHDFTSCERTNSLGIRDHEMSVAKTGAFRIVAIGDSFTYGWGVNLEDTWCKRLEKNLRDQGLDVEVVNMGKPAAGPCEYASIAELAIPVFQPDLVIVCILNGDDLQQSSWLSGMRAVRFPNLVRLVWYLKNRNAFANPMRPAPRSEEQSREAYIGTAQMTLQQMTPEQRAYFETFDPAVKDAFYKGMLNPWMIGHTTSSPDYFLNTVNLNELSSNIDGMASQLGFIHRIADRWKAAVLVVSVPEGFYVNKEAYANVQRIGFKVVPEMLTTGVVDEAVGIACRKAGLPFYSTLESMRKHMDEKGLYFEMDRHLSAAGNALYADLITPTVAEEVRKLKAGVK